MKGRRFPALCVTFLFGLALASNIVLAANAGDSDSLGRPYADAIFAEYGEEISEIEDEYGVSIDRIDKVTLGYIQNAAIEHYGARPRYAALVDVIALAYTDQSVLENPYGILPLTNEPTEVRNYKSSVIIPLSPERGRLVDTASVETSSSGGVTVSGTFGFTISGKVFGVSIGETVQYNDSYTLNGPAQGTKLHNGYLADGRCYFRIAWGTLTRASWDVVEIRTGRVVSHSDVTNFQPEYQNGKPYARPYFPLYAELGSKIMIDAAQTNVSETGTWDSWSDVDNAVKNFPSSIISGSP